MKRISDFEIRYIVNRGRTKLQRTCENCYEKHPLAYMSQGSLLVCEVCSVDIETLTNRLPKEKE